MAKISKTELRKLIKEQFTGDGTSAADVALWEAVNDYLALKEEELGYNTMGGQLVDECMRVVKEALADAEGVGYGPGGY